MTETQSSVCFAADHAAFEGHFPGDPALPGVVQLMCASDAVATESPGFEIAGARRVRFRHHIRPGSQFTIDIGKDSLDDERTFALRPADAGATASEGAILLTVHSNDQTGRAQIVVPPPRPTARPLDIEAVLPHRGHALLLRGARAILDRGADGDSWLHGRVPESSALVREGRVSAFAALELACQAGAVIPELQRPVDEPMRALEGALVGVREARFAAPSFDVRDELFCAIRCEMKSSFMRICGTVASGPSAAEARHLAAIDLKVLVRA